MTDLILPWPPKELSPNARIHWSKRAKAAKTYRKECWALTLKSGIKVGWEGEIHLWITFFPPDRRKRDDDNAISSFKAGRDGIADALGVDDSRFVTHQMVSTLPINKVIVMLSCGN